MSPQLPEGLLVLFRALLRALAEKAPAITVDHLLAATDPEHEPTSVNSTEATVDFAPAPHEDLPLAPEAQQLLAELGDVQSRSLGEIRQALRAARPAPGL